MKILGGFKGSIEKELEKMVWIPSCGAERFGNKEMGRQPLPCPQGSHTSSALLEREETAMEDILRDRSSQKEQALSSYK